jgi:hypothetical protein
LACLVQMPSGPRKSDSPDSVLMPAPVKTTRYFASNIHCANSLTRSSRFISESLFPLSIVSYPKGKPPKKTKALKHFNTLLQIRDLSKTNKPIHRGSRLIKGKNRQRENFFQLLSMIQEEYPRYPATLSMTKKGAWLEVNAGGSLLRIEAMAGCLLNSLSRNCLINFLLHPFG